MSNVVDDEFSKLLRYQEYGASFKKVTKIGEELPTDEIKLVEKLLERLPLSDKERKQLRGLSKLELAELLSIIPLSEFPNAGVLRTEHGFYLINKDRLAKGGYGGVYKAFSSNLHRSVALKTLLNDTPNGRALLKREGQAQANEAHQNIISVFGYVEKADSTVEELKDKPIIVMEYLDPDNSTTLEKFKDVSPREIISLSEQMFTALHQMLKPKLNRVGRILGSRWGLTEKGGSLLHMDIKPENIFVTDEGLVKLGDFGIASTVIDQGNLNNPRIGSPLWASPERILSSHVPDVRSELFSYTSVIYKVMTGKAYFRVEGDQDSEEVQMQVLKRVAFEPFQFTPEFKKYCEVHNLDFIKMNDFFSKAWAKDPDNRYQTIAEYREALIDAFTPVA